mgnify:FL=1
MGDAGALFESEKVWKLLLRITPPVMLAQLIQALYNIVDSYFVGRYSGNGLTALSVIFPLQLIITALAVGTGVGLNTQMSRLYARRRREEADAAAGAGMVLAVLSWLVFAVVSLLLMRPYVRLSANTPEAVDYAVTYGNIVCGGSLGIFLESCWTKVHQAGGNMKLPMAAQIAGALTNIVLDPILIFGLGPVPELGVAGAAIATVAGQFVAAAITGVRGWRRPPALKKLGTYARPIYRLGYPSILMQSLYTVYIVALNVILAGFCDEAVTVLGLYYKLQTFFFIPLMGLETCIVPVLSYNYTRARYDRCREIMRVAFLISSAFMLVGTLCFWLIPGPMIGLFSRDAQVLAIGVHAFRLIGLSFLPAVLSLLFPVFFQAIGMGRPSVLLSLTRQIFCLIPIFWLLSLLGLSWTWLAFLLSECITDIPGILLYCKTLRQWKEKERGVQTT